MRAIVKQAFPLKKYQIVLVAKSPAATLDFDGMQRDIMALLTKAGLADEKKEA